MSKISSNPVKPVEYAEKTLIKAGTYPVRVVGLYNFGPQERSYQGVKKGPAELVRVVFELVTVKGAVPTLLGKNVWVTGSGLGNWFPLLEVLTNKSGSAIENVEVTDLLGAAAVATVVIKKFQEREYNFITVITAPPEDYAVKEAKTDYIVFLAHSHTEDEFTALPQWAKDKVMIGLGMPSRTETQDF